MFCIPVNADELLHCTALLFMMHVGGMLIFCLYSDSAAHAFTVSGVNCFKQTEDEKNNAVSGISFQMEDDFLLPNDSHLP